MASVDLLSGAVPEAQVGWRSLCRSDGSEWSSAFVAHTPKASTFAARERAEGILGWLRAVAPWEKAGAEYMLIPFAAAERGL